MMTVKKSKFVKHNDKRYYFSDGIASLLWCTHTFLRLESRKKESEKKIEGLIVEEKIDLIRQENKSV